ncbi:MAG: TIM barrel protein [Sulfitobacter sp.]|nr:TIM barrel protein [Sulfitobacter sp.]
MKFAANLTFLWAELPYLDRFNAAADAGFEAVEILFPYDNPAKETQRALTSNGLQMVLLNAPPPNYTGGQRGFAAQPDMVARFRHDIQRAYRYAEALGVSFVHVMSGEAEGAAAKQTFVDNLRWAAENAPEELTLTVEPLNQIAMPGYFMSDYGLAADVLEAVAAPNVALQYDSYHAQMIHGDAVAVYEQYSDLTGHIQIGDTPRRGVPGSGDVDFATLFDRIESSGYDGWISAEYHTDGRTADTLNWMKRS